MVSEIGEPLRRQPCPYPKRKCESCPHFDKQKREEGGYQGGIIESKKTGLR